MGKTKKIAISIVAIMLIIGIPLLMFYVKNSNIDKMYIYEIDNNKNEVTIIRYINDELESEKTNPNYKEVVEIPETIKGYAVTAIGEEAFIWSKMKKVIIPETVTEIKSRAFFGCKNLMNIEGVDNVTKIESQAFYMCTALKSIDLSNITYLGDHVFFECENITSLYFSSTIEEIPIALCNKMRSLKDVTLSENTKAIDRLAFANCTSLNELKIPESVTEISEDAFQNIESQLTICGEKGSYAEKYAENKDIKFSVIEDDTSSYGPETITLTWTENNGSCSYYVYDYSNGGNSNSMALSYSSAKVVVYKGNTLLNTFNVPVGYNGTKWNVFTINSGALTTMNTIS